MADVVGYSRLMGADESGTHARLKAVRAGIVDPAIERHDGRIVHTAGDGLLCDFPSVVDAVRCAIAIQTEMTEHASDGRDDPLLFRIGIHLGDVIDEGDDIFGDGVNVAARLQEIADRGGICISHHAHDVVRSEFAGLFEEGSEETLKNIDRPIKVWRWRPRGIDDPTAVIAGDVDQPTIAVIPFANLSSDRELDFHADGLTEDIITMLARTPGFLVISRYSALSYRGAGADVKTVGRELGARYVVDGSIRPVGNRLRITVSLADATGGNELWSERFEQRVDEMPDVEDEVTAAIVAHLRPELNRAEVELARRYQPKDMDAWALYRKAGAALFRSGWNEDTFRTAADLYRQSIERDEGFALAHGALSLTLAIGHLLGFVSDDEAEEGTRAAERALQLTADDPEVLGFAGCALSDLGDHDRGIDVMERAIELNPCNAQAWTGLGSAYLAKGEIGQAVEKLSHGLRISPRDPRLAMWGSLYALALGRQGRLEEGIEEARKARRRDQKLYNSRLVLAVLLARAGYEGDAEAALQDARRLRPELSLRDVDALTGSLGMEALKGIWDAPSAIQPITRPTPDSSA